MKHSLDSFTAKTRGIVFTINGDSEVWCFPAPHNPIPIIVRKVYDDSTTQLKLNTNYND
ncbi:unnamed protein product [Sphenostylis stenocarpa]|uniref:Uncharacterized protein n=1 Tax=Sphenostylis stenocarpa TaxID=92480 RepID=A0AA86SRD7_9FABA|nr:unnamed protein product [Sphenostylis stenocarpa]